MMLKIVIWRDTQVAIRGPSAKGLDCVSGARVRIPLSPPSLPKERWTSNQDTINMAV